MDSGTIRETEAMHEEDNVSSMIEKKSSVEQLDWGSFFLSSIEQTAS